jgi:hypothetical protein
VLLQQGTHLLLVPFNERYDALPEVFGDVLRLILQSSILLLFVLRG